MGTVETVYMAAHIPGAFDKPLCGGYVYPVKPGEEHLAQPKVMPLGSVLEADWQRRCGKCLSLALDGVAAHHLERRQTYENLDCPGDQAERLAYAAKFRRIYGREPY